MNRQQVPTTIHQRKYLVNPNQQLNFLNRERQTVNNFFYGLDLLLQLHHNCQIFT